MNQSSIIFFFMFAAYFVFITVRGELPVYMGLLLSTPDTSAPIVKQGTGSNLTASDYASYAKTAAEIAAVAL